MAELIKDLIMGESGQGMAEYSLLLAFVALAVTMALGNLGNMLKSTYQTTAGKFLK